MKTALTIAGSDSGGGAGIQADLKTFTAHGVFGLSAVTAVTAQNTLGVAAWQAIPADLVTAQIEAVAGDIGVDGVKTGMLATRCDRRSGRCNDREPGSTSGRGRSGDDPKAAHGARRRGRWRDAAELIPRAHGDAECRGSGCACGISVRTLDDAREAAKRIAALGPGAVIVKGGHLASVDAIDIFYDGRDFVELRSERIKTRHTHRTGCTFSSAIAAANLALGLPLVDAVKKAKIYLTEAIRRAPGLGRGHGPLGPP